MSLLSNKGKSSMKSAPASLSQYPCYMYERRIWQWMKYDKDPRVLAGVSKLTLKGSFIFMNMIPVPKDQTRKNTRCLSELVGY